MPISVFRALPTGIEGVRSFVCDATLSVAPVYTNTITQHPVESSSNISDHAYNKNPVITINGVVSNSYSSEDYLNNPGLVQVDNEIDIVSNRVETAYNLLKDLWNERTTFEVQSEHQVYKDCILRSFSTDFTNTTSEALVFSLSVEQIRTVDTQRVRVSLVDESIKDDAEETTTSNDIKVKADSGKFKLDNWFRGD